MTLPIFLLLAPLAFAGNRYADTESDIIAKATVAAPVSDVYDWLLDLSNQSEAWTPECASSWVPGEVTTGVGASTRVTYYAAHWNRKLVMTIDKVVANRRVSLDHAGKKGFVTTWTLETVGAGTDVEVHTWINSPPWPIRGYYFKHVQPAWTACHQKAVDNLDRILSEAAPMGLPTPTESPVPAVPVETTVPVE